MRTVCSTLLLILAILFIKNNQLMANWNPILIPEQDRVNSIESLENPNITNHKAQIFAYLENSWCNQEKAELIFDTVFLTESQTCVEIGAFQGACTLPMVSALKCNNTGIAFVIDAWSRGEAVAGLDPHDPHTEWWSSLDFKGIKKQCKKMIRKWSLKPFVKVKHATSANAAPEIGTIDFLHLDGNFSADGALNDTQLYLPKVRSGGYVLISSLMFVINKESTKRKALWPIFDACEVICELESSNVILFRKR